MLSIKEIKSYINSLGIDIVGFSNVIDDSNYQEHLNKLNDLNMKYQRNYDQRLYSNPRLLVDDASLIISIGLSYNYEYQISNKNYFGYYSKSSYGKDYHQKLYAILNQIDAYLNDNILNYSSYLSCDTKACDDRYYAYICGNGYYGKNNMIINNDYGTNVFYATIITNIKLDVLSDIKDNECNECSLCIDNCPTKALTKDGIKAYECLSHLTQSDSLIEPEILNHRLFGCDVCTNVCPKNKGLNKLKSDEIEIVSLIDFIELSNKEFNDKYQHKSMAWQGNKYLTKNALLNLGLYMNQEEVRIYLKRKYKEYQDKKMSKLYIETIQYLFEKWGEPID